MISDTSGFNNCSCGSDKLYIEDEIVECYDSFERIAIVICESCHKKFTYELLPVYRTELNFREEWNRINAK